jgi:hypothetical protein
MLSSSEALGMFIIVISTAVHKNLRLNQDTKLNIVLIIKYIMPYKQ